MDLVIPDVMDTTTLSEKGVAMPVRRPDTGQPLYNGDKPVAITVYGPDSKCFRDAQREIDKKRAQAVMGGGETDEEALRAELLARVTKSWTGFLDKAGNQVNCTREHAIAVYTQFPVIRDQVENFVTSRRNFIKASPDASLPSPAGAGA